MTDWLLVFVFGFPFVFVGVGTWLGLKWARRRIRRTLSRADLSKLDPATRARIEREIRDE